MSSTAGYCPDSGITVWFWPWGPWLLAPLRQVVSPGSHWPNSGKKRL